MATLDAFLKSNGVNKETLERLTVESHRNVIANEIDEDWEDLASVIGVPSGDVDEIKLKYGNQRPLDRSLAMMKIWHGLWGKEATYLRLFQGLWQIGRGDLMERVIVLNSGNFGTDDDHQESCKCVRSFIFEQATWLIHLQPDI